MLSQFTAYFGGDLGVLWHAGAEGASVTQAKVQYTATESGRYYFLIETYASNSVGITVNLSTQYGQTTTAVVYQTVISTTAYTLSQILTSVMVQQPPQSPLNVGSSGMLLPVIGIVIVVALTLIGYLAMKRRKKAA